jgi:hypothetical protein
MAMVGGFPPIARYRRRECGIFGTDQVALQNSVIATAYDVNLYLSKQ